jgi:hypothetical protein
MNATLTASSALVTRWQARQHRERSALYLDVTTGHGVTDDGRAVTCTPGASLRTLLEEVPPYIERLYLCGTLPAAPQVGQHGRTTADLYAPFHSWLWAGDPTASYLKAGAMHSQTLARYAREQGVRPLMVRPIASWLDRNDCTPEEAHAALSLVQQQLQRQHGWDGAPLLETPAETGRELWRRAIGYDQAYPVLRDDVRALIHATSGQGRYEMCAPPSDRETLPDLYCLDGRWMYAAPCLEELGICPVTHDGLPDYAGHAPARYLVRFEVPPGWAHVGVFMAPAGTLRHGWHFPATPGYVGQTWADAAEVRVALWPFPHACAVCAAGYRANAGPMPQPCPEHGWRIRIVERLVFTKGRPLTTWAKKLGDVRSVCDGNELARAAVRNILIHALGAFHSTQREVQRSAGEDERERIPDHTAARLLQMPDGEERFVWGERRRHNPDPHYDRPELPAQVWARTRARMLLHRDANGHYTGALTLPREAIVGFQLDALYTTIDPGWPDDGKPGRLRSKGHLAHAAPWPRTQDELNALKRQMGSQVESEAQA